MASKKLKKFLKKAGMAAAAVGALGALRNRTAAANRIKGMIENDSFANARKLMTSNPAMRGNIYTDAIMRKQPLRNQDMNPAMFLTGVGDDPVIEGIQAGAKDGGKIVKTEKGGKAVRRKKKIGIQIKGFGKARRG
tara:strand:+ start:78 stop:485 length:408 start_codon:yes stop_codon:yes gene_type:complete